MRHVRRKERRQVKRAGGSRIRRAAATRSRRTRAYVALIAVFIVIVIVILNAGPENGGSGQSDVSGSGAMYVSDASLLSTQDTEIRAVSLAAIERDLADDGQATEAAQLLGGIKRLCGFVVDKPNHDVVVYGYTGDGPSLNLDDFVVALRCEQPPGCSIDPSAATLKAIKQLDPISTAGSVAQMDASFAALREIGEQQQSVRAVNVPNDTGFLKVLVDADYQLKRIANGTDTPDVKGLRSVTDSMIDACRQEYGQGRIGQIPMIMNRFWFAPGKVTFREVPEMTAMERCEVRLLTENEHINHQGQATGTGQVEFFAQTFADGFTRVYDQTAEAQPIYAELRAMFEHVAVARAMDRAEVFLQACLDAPELCGRYNVRSVAVSRTLAGIADVRKLPFDSGGGQAYIWLFSMGGVDIDITRDSLDVSSPVSPRERARLQELRDQILGARPGKELYWTVRQIPPNPRRIHQSLLSGI